MEVLIHDNNTFSNNNDPYFILAPPVISVNQSLPSDTKVSTGATAEFECQFGTAHPKSCNDEHIFTYYQLTDNNSLIPVLQQTHGCVISEDVGIPINNSRYELTISKLEDEEIFLKYRYTFYIHNVTMEDNGSVFSCHVTNNYQIQWQNEAQLSVYLSFDINEDNGPRHGRTTVAAAVVVTVVFCALATTSLLLFIMKKKKKSSVLLTDQGILCFLYMCVLCCGEILT